MSMSTNNSVLSDFLKERFFYGVDRTVSYVSNSAVKLFSFPDCADSDSIAIKIFSEQYIQTLNHEKGVMDLGYNVRHIKKNTLPKEILTAIENKTITTGLIIKKGADGSKGQVHFLTNNAFKSLQSSLGISPIVSCDKLNNIALYNIAQTILLSNSILALSIRFLNNSEMKDENGVLKSRAIVENVASVKEDVLKQYDIEKFIKKISPQYEFVSYELEDTTVMNFINSSVKVGDKVLGLVARFRKNKFKIALGYFIEDSEGISDFTELKNIPVEVKYLKKKLVDERIIFKMQSINNFEKKFKTMKF